MVLCVFLCSWSFSVFACVCFPPVFVLYVVCVVLLQRSCFFLYSCWFAVCCVVVLCVGVHCVCYCCVLPPSKKCVCAIVCSVRVYVLVFHPFGSMFFRVVCCFLLVYLFCVCGGVC